MKKHNVTVAIISYLTRMLMEFQNVFNYTHKTFYEWPYIFASHCSFISRYRTKSIVKFASGNFPFFSFASEIKVRIFFLSSPFLIFFLFFFCEVPRTVANFYSRECVHCSNLTGVDLEWNAAKVWWRNISWTAHHGSISRSVAVTDFPWSA